MGKSLDVLELLGFNDVRRAEVLDWVNSIRGEFGAPPIQRLPKGIMCDAAHCVLAKAIRDGSDLVVLVDEERLHVRNGLFSRSESLPDSVLQFIEDFDSFKYPDLVASI